MWGAGCGCGDQNLSLGLSVRCGVGKLGVVGLRVEEFEGFALGQGKPHSDDPSIKSQLVSLN